VRGGLLGGQEPFAFPPPAEPAPLDPPIAAISGDTLAWAIPELTAFARGLRLASSRHTGGARRRLLLREKQARVRPEFDSW
jgi:hypothetical protein